MTTRVRMCKAGKSPSRCGMSCYGCYSYDTVMICTCDKCRKEIDTVIDTNPRLCSVCKTKLKKRK